MASSICCPVCHSPLYQRRDGMVACIVANPTEAAGLSPIAVPLLGLPEARPFCKKGKPVDSVFVVGGRRVGRLRVGDEGVHVPGEIVARTREGCCTWSIGRFVEFGDTSVQEVWT